MAWFGNIFKVFDHFTAEKVRKIASLLVQG
jgi:hypothetical protein